MSEENNNYSKDNLEYYLIKLERRMVRAKMVLIIIHKSEIGIKTYHLEKGLLGQYSRPTIRNTLYLLQEKGLIKLTSSSIPTKMRQLITKGENKHFDYFKNHLKLIIADEKKDEKVLQKTS